MDLRIKSHLNEEGLVYKIRIGDIKHHCTERQLKDRIVELTGEKYENINLTTTNYDNILKAFFVATTEKGKAYKAADFLAAMVNTGKAEQAAKILAEMAKAGNTNKVADIFNAMVNTAGKAEQAAKILAEMAKAGNENQVSNIFAKIDAYQFGKIVTEMINAENKDLAVDIIAKMNANKVANMFASMINEENIDLVADIFNAMLKARNEDQANNIFIAMLNYKEMQNITTAEGIENPTIRDLKNKCPSCKSINASDNLINASDNLINASKKLKEIIESGNTNNTNNTDSADNDDKPNSADNDKLKGQLKTKFKQLNELIENVLSYNDFEILNNNLINDTVTQQFNTNRHLKSLINTQIKNLIQNTNDQETLNTIEKYLDSLSEYYIKAFEVYQIEYTSIEANKNDKSFIGHAKNIRDIYAKIICNANTTDTITISSKTEQQLTELHSKLRDVNEKLTKARKTNGSSTLINAYENLAFFYEKLIDAINEQDKPGIKYAMEMAASYEKLIANAEQQIEPNTQTASNPGAGNSDDTLDKLDAITNEPTNNPVPPDSQNGNNIAQQINDGQTDGTANITDTITTSPEIEKESVDAKNKLNDANEKLAHAYNSKNKDLIEAAEILHVSAENLVKARENGDKDLIKTAEEMFSIAKTIHDSAENLVKARENGDKDLIKTAEILYDSTKMLIETHRSTGKNKIAILALHAAAQKQYDSAKELAKARENDNKDLIDAAKEIFSATKAAYNSAEPLLRYTDNDKKFNKNLAIHNELNRVSEKKLLKYKEIKLKYKKFKEAAADHATSESILLTENTIQLDSYDSSNIDLNFLNLEIYQATGNLYSSANLVQTLIEDTYCTIERIDAAQKAYYANLAIYYSYVAKRNAIIAAGNDNSKIAIANKSFQNAIDAAQTLLVTADSLRSAVESKEQSRIEYANRVHDAALQTFIYAVALDTEQDNNQNNNNTTTFVSSKAYNDSVNNYLSINNRNTTNPIDEDKAYKRIKKQFCSDAKSGKPALRPIIDILNSKDQSERSIIQSLCSFLNLEQLS